MIRVVIPALHAEESLPTCVQAILRSSIDVPIEILVVEDEGSNSQLQVLLATFPIQIRRTRCNGDPALARNLGASDFQRGFLVFVDPDVIVETDTISRLLEPLCNAQAQASLGNYSSEVDQLSFLQRYKQLYISTVYKRSGGFIRNDFWTALSAVRADIFHKCGGFDVSIREKGTEATELGKRLSQEGFKIVSLPQVCGLNLKKYTFIELIKNDFRKSFRNITACLQSKNHLADNRHASKQDILAVVCAPLLPLFLIWTVASTSPSSTAFLLVFTLMYLRARADLLKVYARQDFIFLAPSFLLTVVLDIVRAASTFWATLRWFPHRKRTLHLAVKSSTSGVTSHSQNKSANSRIRFIR